MHAFTVTPYLNTCTTKETRIAEHQAPPVVLIRLCTSVVFSSSPKK